MANKTRRANVTPTVKMELLCEVNGKCPLCNRSLLSREKDKITRVFDVAHIYPLNATPIELELLKNEEKITQDIDTEENFIALCKICHKIYDTKKTIKEYKELVAIKKTILKEKELNIIWNNQQLNKDIAKVAENIYKLDSATIKDTILSYDVLKINDKKDETLNLPNLMKIELYVKNYYLPIKNSFKLLELEERTKSEFIFSQVKTFYLALKMQGYNQNEIFEKMVDWFMTNTNLKDRSKSEILVAFFIQNCEVFS